METYKYLTLSTAHIQESDNDVLNRAVHETNSVMKRKYGYFIKLSESLKFDLAPNGFEYSESVKNIICFAHLHNFKLIELDCDVESIYQLPTWEW